MAAFTRQHFVKFANIIKNMTGANREFLTIELLKMFKADNPRFDAERFLKAAGVEENTRIAKVLYHESVGMGMKLVTLLPAGRITTLRHGGSARPMNESPFHGGNPTADDVQLLEDDFDDELMDAENTIDNVLSGIVDAAKEADFTDVSAAIASQVQLLRRDIGMFRRNVERIYDAKKKKLAGK